MPIIIIDNNPQSLDNTASLIEESGYNTYSFQHPHHALHYLQKSRLLPGILVADYNIGEMNGFDLHYRLQPVAPTLQTLIISPQHHSGTVNGLHFLQKPFTSESLMLKIHKMKLLAGQHPAATAPGANA